MLSATPLAALGGVAATGDMQGPSETFTHLGFDLRFEDSHSDSIDWPHLTAEDLTDTEIRRELVFVDVGGVDYRPFVDDVLTHEDPVREIEIHLLDGALDGVQQITEILNGQTEVDAIHLVSHGTKGKVKFGDVWLDNSTLDTYANELATWNDALRDNADLLIYGCDLASSHEGRTLSAGISNFSGADVAASTDTTGHAELGGDWDLEFRIGTVETEVAFTTKLQTSWLAVLPNNPPTTIGLPDVVVVENTADTIIDLTAYFSDVEDLSSDLGYVITNNTDSTLVSPLVDNGADTLTLTYLPNQTGAASITILAIDTGGLTVDTTFMVTVNPTGGNQTPTDITLDNTTVAENSPGAIFGNLGVVDPDTGDTHTWQVDDARFEVVSDQLKLKAGQSLNFETEPSVNLTITATDSGALSYNELFTIAVTNVNEAPTGITLDNTTVAENADGGIVGNLNVADPDADDVHTWLVDDVRFEVVAGQLKLKAGQSLNRETEPSVDVTITATDAGALSHNELFTITVTNVNEAPTGITLDNTTVAENADGGIVGNLNVADPDADDVHTWLVDDVRFEVVAGQLKLKAGQSLNRETEPSVGVTITATDAGALSHNELFTITVTNVNEAPIDVTLGNTTVAENAAGAIVGNLNVVDPDAGDVHTWLVDDVRFEVVAGQLKLKAGQSLNRETEPSVGVTITATDAGALSHNELFTITVTNVNEAPIDVTLDNTTVAENAVGAIIGNLGVVDPDAGDVHTWFVDDVRFEVVAGQLKLKAGQSLNRETEPSVGVTITATDAGALSHNELFTVTVTNVNEPPTDITTDTFNVPDGTDTSGGLSLGPLVAVDEDVPESFSYSIGPGGHDILFRIGGVGNDELILDDGVLDEANQNSYLVTVRVTDSGANQYDELLTVNVTNVNASPTDIMLDNSTVAENDSGGVVGNLSVVDPDVGDTHIWAVDDARFEILAGQLKLKAGQSLNREIEPSVNLTVTATDAGALAYNELFTITVTNVNEPPTDITLDNMTAPENMPGGIIGNLRVVDPDAGDTHTWSVDDTRFEAVAGQLKLKAGQNLDFETEPSVNLVVTATDNGALAYAQTFTITVTNINEAPFDITLDNTSVAENAVGANVGNLGVVDPDVGDTHTWLVDDARFEIVAGQLMLNAGQSLDFENEPNVNLTISVRDGGTLVYNELMTLAVVDINEAPTDITTDTFHISDATDTSGGLSLGRLVTVDQDSPEVFSYSIQPGGDAVLFSIGGVSNDELFFDDGVLDAATKSIYSVTVRVTDSGGNPFDELLTVTVTDVNAAPTDILLDGATLVENDVGGTIGNLIVVDPDVFDTHTWSVDDARFEVLAGQLKLKSGQNLDFETAPNFSVAVTATDDGGLGYSELFTIMVLDANDNPPIVTPSQNLRVNEDAVDTTSLGTVIATDVDTVGALQDWTITAGNSDGVFAINPATGEITVVNNSNLNFETEPSYLLSITVSDGANVSAIEFVTITVGDVPEDVTDLPPPPPPPRLPPEFPGETSTREGDPAVEAPSGTVPPQADPPPRTSQSSAPIDGQRDSSNTVVAAHGFETEFSDDQHDANAVMLSEMRLAKLLPGLERETRSPQPSVPELGNLPPILFAANNQDFLVGIQALRDEVRFDTIVDTALVGATFAVTSGISVGYVVWLIRGGVLLSSFLTSLPAWNIVDPLPVLSSMKLDDPDGDDDSLESLIRDGEKIVANRTSRRTAVRAHSTDNVDTPSLVGSSGS